MENLPANELLPDEPPRRPNRSIFYDNYSFVYILAALGGYLISAGLIYMNIRTRLVAVEINRTGATPFLYTITEKTIPPQLWAPPADRSGLSGADSLVFQTDVPATSFFVNPRQIEFTIQTLCNTLLDVDFCLPGGTCLPAGVICAESGGKPAKRNARR